MEKLFLEAFFAFHELNVVDEQNVYFAVPAFKSRSGVAANGIDVFVHERFGRHITHFVMRIVLVDIFTNGVQEVGFSQTS